MPFLVIHLAKQAGFMFFFAFQFDFNHHCKNFIFFHSDFRCLVFPVLLFVFFVSFCFFYDIMGGWRREWAIQSLNLSLIQVFLYLHFLQGIIAFPEYLGLTAHHFDGVLRQPIIPRCVIEILYALHSFICNH